MSALENRSTAEVARVVALACRLHGLQRGWAVAGAALGISCRTARGIAYGEATGASVPEHLVDAALNTLRRARAAQLRAELAALEDAHADEVLDAVRPPARVVR